MQPLSASIASIKRIVDGYLVPSYKISCNSQVNIMDEAVLLRFVYSSVVRQEVTPDLVASGLSCSI